MSRRNSHVTGRNWVAVGAVGLLFLIALACFCSVLPLVLLVSLLFNTLVLGSGLYSALAQEREKRTIDALRLTQLSSLDILRYKSMSDWRVWKKGNLLFLLLAAVAALATGSPLGWAVVGQAAMAAGGLFSIALALAVSTRCETTSSAVVTGWVSKGVWLVGLPILDYVLEAVFVMSRDLNFFSYLDPAWVYGTVVSALIFETGFSTLFATVLGSGFSVALAALLVWQSSKLIDDSFESAATLEDRNRHSAYSRKFVLGLHNNPFMVREMAWQMRSGAGAWPGYAVFFTLFLAPFLYGVAQHHKGHEQKPVRVVRHSVTTTAPLPDLEEGDSSHSRPHTPMPSLTERDPSVRYHDHLCLSQMMGLPVPSNTRSERYNFAYASGEGDRIVVGGDGKAFTVATTQVDSFTQSATYTNRYATSGNGLSRTYFQSELDRGLLTGLVLTILYLFIRGGAFMSSAVTGEKERRAWDQIALTGASAETYLGGKLAGVLYYPLKQLAFTTPALLLFAAFGGISLAEILMVVPLLFATFLAASGIGLLCSTGEASSHQAQGKALVVSAAVLLLPVMPTGWFWAGLLTFAFLGKTAWGSNLRLGASVGVALWIAVFGPATSPLVGVMQACDYSGFGFHFSDLPGFAALLAGTVSMAALALGSYWLAVWSLNEGGSVKA